MPLIVADDNGFCVSLDNSVLWSDVQKVVAYKRDELTTDLICLEFLLLDSRLFTLHEELEGWVTFVEGLPQHLPGCPTYADWFRVVAHPPFATNETILWRKAPHDIRS